MQEFPTLKFLLLRKDAVDRFAAIKFEVWSPLKLVVRPLAPVVLLLEPEPDVRPAS